MEKTTKKRKKTKGARKRIGIIAVGGLSLVLTICLSVGATLAWFAGSTWSSNQLYMGGPVYVEMAGRGASGTTAGENDGSIAKWQGGAGNLDIRAATSRTTGTATDTDDATDTPSSIPNNILLPGQKFEIYSQARVFSTSHTTTIDTDEKTSMNSGSNVANTSKSGTAHITDKGRVTSTTTSVLRARFSVSVEFDPTVGFNNFTAASYHTKYPVQSAVYQGDTWDNTESEIVNSQSLAWEDALGATEFKGTITGAAPGVLTYPEDSRRDAVPNGDDEFTAALDDTAGDLTAIKNGTIKSIYSWKFVSSDVYTDTDLTAPATMIDDAADQTKGVTSTYKYIQMDAPFNGPAVGSTVGYYGVWILKTNAGGKNCLSESNSFYKARCNSYIDSYVEEYMTEYGEVKTRTIGDSLASLENSLNQSFIDLVNDSSNKILDGYVNGMTVSDGIITYKGDGAGESKHPTNASWLYIDPTIGNDTNTNELSTSAGGWWYLVACDSGKVGHETTPNKVAITKDNVTGSGLNRVNTPTTPNLASGTAGTDYFTRDTSGFDADDNGATSRLDAMLYEINPLLTPDFEDDNNNVYSFTGGNTNVKKIVSYSFPFVNGTAALPGDALTNVFANAKITIQISFQALQAFFPYSTNIDNMQYTDALLGTAKALSIRNAIPIYNEAFDYQETVSVNGITGL